MKTRQLIKKNDMSEQKASLFVGRWQPFHAGHKALIETVLTRGKPVVIAIRDTQPSKDNPYTVSERWNMMQRSLHEYGELVKVVVIPDIDEFCFGRDVGYAVREINLSASLKSISGTKIRREEMHRHPIYWIFGQSKSGKTTLAYKLRKELGAVVLDGDEMRESISIEEGFSEEDRHRHNLRVARLGLILSKQSPVIVSVITPFNRTRKEIDRIAEPTWIYIEKSLPIQKDRPFEAPRKYHVKLNSDCQTPQEQLKIILKYIKS